MTNHSFVLSVSSCAFDCDSILQQFPTFELCYENNIHKKVYNADVVLVIPDGVVSMAWFYLNQCWLLTLDTEHKCISHVTPLEVSFHRDLSNNNNRYGTVLFGTHFDNCFCVEDIYFYKGHLCHHKTFDQKLELLKHIFDTQIHQQRLSEHYTVFGLPIVCSSFDVALKDMLCLPYRVRYIKCRYFSIKHKIMTLDLNAHPPWTLKHTKHNGGIHNNHDNNKSYNGLNNNNNNNNNNNKTHLKTNAVFKVVPDIAFDVYHLYDHNNQYVNVACITNYKMSVMMNRLFRNIKENNSLDAIEESDDESDFEDTRHDKYVHLHKELYMMCEYHPTFDKWMPKCVV